MSENVDNRLASLRIHEVSPQGPHPLSEHAPAARDLSVHELTLALALKVATATPAPDPSLGPINAFLGTWSGVGFNTIFRPNSPVTPTVLPHSYGSSDNVLELNLTLETLTFSPSLGSIPNRGMLGGQGDIFLNGIPYVQSVEDVTDPANPTGIHFEPGIWLSVPSTVNPQEPASLARMASIPHGTTIEAQGTATATAGPPIIPPIDITPFPIGNPGSRIPFPSQNATNTATARIPQTLPATITQAMITDPTSVLRSAIVGQTIIRTVHIAISTAPAAPLFGGGTSNIAFLEGNAAASAPNANAALMSADFWLETVQRPNGTTFQQLQYSQMVMLNFVGLSWPHLSVATLRQVKPHVALRAPNGRNFLTVVNEGGMANAQAPIQSNARSVGPNEKFTLQWLNQGAGTFALRTPNGHFLTVVGGGGVGGPNTAASPIHSDASWTREWEILTLEPQFDGTYALQSGTGFYLTATNGGGLSGPVVLTTATTIGANETLTLVSL